MKMRPMKEADRSSEDNIILGYTSIKRHSGRADGKLIDIPVVIWPNLSSDRDQKHFLWMSEYGPVRNEVLIGWKPLP